MNYTRGIVRRSEAGAHVIEFLKPGPECVAATDSWPRATRARQMRTSAAYRISQVIARADAAAYGPLTKTVWGD